KAMILIGRLTKDAVVAQLKDERQVVNFTLAVNDSYKQKGSDKWETITTYFNCVYWISAKVAERLKKGNLVEITGRLYVNAYKDMQGEARANLNCHVDSIKIHQQMKSTESKTQSEKTEEVKDDLPF
ncbi:MAG: single-stranded DNA-binding protein, partial [Ferruginibacter sp.]